MGGIRTYSIDTLPEPGEIAWCRFPLRERPGQPGPVARPTLVLQTKVHQHDTGALFGSVWVSYGTDLDKVKGRPHLPIEPMWRARQMGLHKPTGFCFDNASVKNLLWCPDYFVPPDYVASCSIIIGRLEETERDRARVLWRQFR